MARRLWGPAIGVGVAAAVLLVAGACSSSDSGSGSDEGATEETIGLRAPGPVDTGVITSYEPSGSGFFIRRVDADDDTPPEIAPDGLAATLTSCRAVGIDQWWWEGTITLPDGVDRATVDLELIELGAPGPGQARWRTTAEVSGSGAFTIERGEVDPIRPDDPGVLDSGIEASSYQPEYRSQFERCALRIVDADVPVVTDADSEPIDATRDDRPIEVDAPDGTVDALADGVHLGDLSDGRLPFAYVAAHEQSFPFDELVVPDLDLVPVTAIYWWTPTDGEDCPQFVTSGSVRIVQTDACTGPAEDHDGRAEPAEGLDGWSWLEDPDGERSLRGQVDGWWIHLAAVEDPVISEEDLLAIARSLYPVRNDRVDEVTPRRDTGPDLDIVVEQVAADEAASMRPFDVIEERARLSYGDGWLVALEKREGTTRWELQLGIARPHGSDWRLEILYSPFIADSGQFEQPHALCLGATPPYRSWPVIEGEETVPVQVIATKDPTWTLEGADTPGAWAPLPTTEGIWIGLDEADGPVEKPPYLRAVDEQGRPVEGAVAAEHACLP